VDERVVGIVEAFDEAEDGVDGCFAVRSARWKMPCLAGS
jgi:hypothetical protein